jgi:hypothetical protein
VSGGEDPAGAVRLDWLDPAADLEVLAVIHATVDLERALVERGASPGGAAGSVPDELLGARVVVVGEGSARTAVAEPSTEGRLAATLARHGEGIVGSYLRGPFPLADMRTRAAAAGIVLSRPAAGPFGDEVIVVGARLGGPQVILVDPGRVPSRR